MARATASASRAPAAACSAMARPRPRPDSQILSNIFEEDQSLLTAEPETQDATQHAWEAGLTLRTTILHLCDGRASQRISILDFR